MIDSFKGRWSFLSNFYPCLVEHQGIEYPSVEHFYVAMKIDSNQIINGNHYTLDDFREMVSKLSSGGMAKKIGQKVKLRRDWDEKKLDVMNWGVREKFKNEDLKELLLSTGDQEIVEGNFWHDNFYGQCNCDKCKNKGKNNLGKILMSVRDEIRGINKKGLEDILK